MYRKKSGSLRNVSYTLASNTLGLLISVMITMLVPKMLGEISYSYFQLYLFYSSYVGLLHFGWADGVFLRYGGAYYQELNKSMFKGQILSFSVVQALFCCLIGIIAWQVSNGREKAIVLSFSAVALLLTNTRTILLYIFQSTNRIKEYAQVVVIEKVIYAVVVIALMVLGIKTFSLYIIANLLGGLCAMTFALVQCKDILRAKAEPLPMILAETKENLRVGFKLVVSNFSSLLIVGIVRQAIEMQWDVTVFGHISLTLSISNMLLVLLSAVAIVLFPMLRRMDERNRVPAYYRIRNILMPVLLGLMVLFYPIKAMMSAWLPRYSDSFAYMAFLFPICVFESKMSLLINTYMKALRKEKSLMMINLLMVLLSCVVTICTVFILRSLDSAAFSIVFLLALRCIIAEVTLAKAIAIHFVSNIIMEVSLVAVFIFANWWVGGLLGTGIYLVGYCAYLASKKRDLQAWIMRMKKRKEMII